MTEVELYTAFAAAGIEFEKLEHPAVYTVDESETLLRSLPAAYTKNLLLKSKGGEFWLVVLPAHCRADLKSLAMTMGQGKFSFAKAEDMLSLLAITPGAVTPIAAVNAPAGAVRVVFDDSFTSCDRIAVHPFRNTATIALPFDQLVAWLSSQGVDVRTVAVPPPPPNSDRS